MSLRLTLLVLSCLSTATVVPAHESLKSYAPDTTACPPRALVRQAQGISPAEASYISKRYRKASQALRIWLKGIDECFTVGDEEYDRQPWPWHHRPGGHSHGHGRKAPVIALTSSGGGYRAQLTGGGVVKGFDGREPNRTKVSGLYQALTYHAGLSGGSWLLSSLAGNDYPTISSLESTIWEPALQDSLLVPEILVSEQARPIYDTVLADIKAKHDAGFGASIIDPWGRLLSYGLLYGTDGGVRDTMSGIASGSNFSCFEAPYPIITALGSDLNINGVCIPQPNATQYEFHPFEFGSWDQGVKAFVDMKFLGTSFSNGRPIGSCITDFDQLGYVLGTSSNVFASACSPVPVNMTAASTSLSLAENLAYLTAPGRSSVPESALFGLFPNPFQDLSSSPHVSAQKTLELVDGGVGIAFQGNPIWPLLHRDVDVIIVNDNSADTLANFPNGSEILHTYQAAKAAGLTRMPVIPSPDVFVAKHLNQKPTFFGCADDSTATIIFIPNFNFTYPSGQPTAKIQYFKNETRGMVDNGVQVANYGGEKGWPLCLACGIMKKSSDKLPDGCGRCFEDYCYN